MTDRKADPVQHLHLLELAVRQIQALAQADAVTAKFQRPAGGDARVEQAQATRRRVTRVGENLAAGFGLALVERGESRVTQINLAAHLDALRQQLAKQAQGYGRDRARVRGDVFALASVAASRRAHELPGLVEQTHGEAVEFRFGAIGKIPVVVELFTQAAVESAHLVFVERVFQRQHRDLVLDGFELARRR